MQLTDRQREFIKNRLKNEPEYVGRANRFKRSKMKKYISDNFYPLDATADTFINDFDLLHAYFSKEINNRLNSLPAPDILVNSLIKKYGEQKIKEAIKRSGL